MQTNFLLRIFEWAISSTINDRKLSLFIDPNEEVEEFGDKKGELIIKNLSTIPGTGSLFGAYPVVIPKRE